MTAPMLLIPTVPYPSAASLPQQLDSLNKQANATSDGKATPLRVLDVVRYLNGATVVAHLPTQIIDRVIPTAPPIDVLYRSDGYFIWENQFAVYVKRYSWSIPPVLLHAVAGHYTAYGHALTTPPPLDPETIAAARARLVERGVAVR